MICGLAAALSVSAMVPVRVPVALGLNWRVSAHEAPEAIVTPTHWLLRSRKSAALAPPCVSALKKTDEVPVLVTVTVWARLVVRDVLRRERHRQRADADRRGAGRGWRAGGGAAPASARSAMR